MSGGGAPGRIKRREQCNGHRDQRNTHDLQRLDRHRQRGTVEQNTDNRHQIIELAGQQRAQYGTQQRPDNPGARSLNHKHRHNLARRQSLGLQDRHFALLFHHHQAKRRDDVKRGNGNDQAQQQAHHVLFHAHGLEQLAFTLAPVLPFGAFRKFLLAQNIHFQRFVEPQTPAANVTQRITH
ncbi:hypothetical protein D3C72_738410 [compost metagenome]